MKIEVWCEPNEKYPGKKITKVLISNFIYNPTRLLKYLKKRMGCSGKLGDGGIIVLRGSFSPFDTSYSINQFFISSGVTKRA